MFENLPPASDAFMDAPWADIAPFYEDLAERAIDAASAPEFLRDWTRLNDLLSEAETRLVLAHCRDTTDERAEARYNRFLDEITEPVAIADQKVREAMLASGVEPEGFEMPLLKMRTAVELFREENVPLGIEEAKLGLEYDQIRGAQTVEWDGREVTLPQLRPVYEETDRARRERAWRLAGARQLADSAKLGDLWTKLMGLRARKAANAACTSYTEYAWRDRRRYDYTPSDCIRFHEAIEWAVLPAVNRALERRRERLGLASIRPWDMGVDPDSKPPLRPFAEAAELEEGCARIFTRVSPDLAEYFERMRAEQLLDLPNRKGKAPGAFSTDLDVERKPFIFMNAVGVHGDVETLLHEAGHAFHTYECAPLPYHQLRQVPMEFVEVASMSMELLGAEFLEREAGGFYTIEEACRARVKHLESILLGWPSIAKVDAFQHWAYANPDDAARPESCSDEWLALTERFEPGLDRSGLEDIVRVGWQSVLHMFVDPFYYVEYGMAQLGAVQVWARSREDSERALRGYRAALALGGTVPLPQLYTTAGARFAFDVATVGEAVERIEDELQRLYARI